MKRIAISLVAAWLAATGAAAAQDNPIKQRQDIMKQNGDAVEKATKMLKGELPYDATEMASGMKKISGAMDKFVTLFPEGSGPKPGVKTDALPAIWENKADFDARAKQLKADAAKAAEAASGGLESFQPAVLAMGRTCKGCHEKYRQKKQ